MKKVLILGSTGSIGQNVLDVVKLHSDKFEVVGLTTKSNIGLLKKQIEYFKVPFCCVVEPNKKIELSSSKVLYSENGLLEIIELSKPDIVVNALVGISGLKPLMFAIKKNIPYIALANKESIVVAGEILNKELEKNKTTKLIPIDSEHSAIFQCLKNEEISKIEKIIITASGGPLFRKKIKHKTVKKITAHPIWKMGKKISVDSATMVNKGFECIEAHFIFRIPYNKIDILIHPQAIFHGFVQFIDGTVLACMFKPDMRIPISYALGCGDERIENLAKKLDILQLNTVEFYKLDYKKFPLLKLLFECINTAESSYLVAFNAANEVLVEKFIAGEIKFDDIVSIMRKIIAEHKPRKVDTIDEVFEIDKETRTSLSTYV
ncbi:MAG: 1-deoxy-D-xylulose-5-phosphate reductoisomerase [Endomicrobia bacterium]|nr:1-deoxy-D-xylulose-5-phosphate reductoisomerase [Endomicrobiia bacterium]